MILGFGKFELDDERRELRSGGTPVELQRKPFALLSYLVHHRDRAVPRDELFDHVWSETVVSDAALTSALHDVRRTLGDDGKSQSWIRTERGRGIRFVGEVEERSAAAGSIAPGPPLIGRSQPLARLEAALGDAARRRPRTVLVAGEAGIGKTRLAQEAAQRAEGLGFRPLWGRCWDWEGAPPFWPWTGVLRAALAGQPGAALLEPLGPRAHWVAHLLPELRGELTPPPASDTPGARFVLFDAVAGLLRSVAAGTPLVVVLDDLHWSDVASLELLRFLSGSLTDAPVLLVGAVRDVELEEGDPRALLLADLARDDAFEEIRLGGLSREDSAALVAQIVAHEPDPEFVRALQTRTGGNPLFIAETLRHLAQSLGEDQREAAWTGTVGLDGAGLAKGVRHVIGRRLAGLAEGCREVLDAASVVGPEFELEVLERMAPLAGKGVPARIDEAASARVIEERVRGTGLWTFGHALIRDVLLSGLGVARRRELHLAVGEALEALHGDDAQPPLATLSHHFEEAGSEGAFAKAFGYAVRAARRSRERFAPEDAAKHFERALQLQKRAGLSDPKLRCELLVEHSRQEPDAEKSALAAERGLELARALDAPELHAQATYALEGAQWALVNEAAPTRIARLEEALAVLGDRDLALRSRLLGRITFVSAGSGGPRAEAASAEAVETARRSGDAAALNYALGARHYSLWRPERARERRLVAREALERATTPYDRNLANEWRFLDALREGDLDGAERANQGELEAATTHLDPFHVSLVEIHVGILAMLQGRMVEAEAVAEREIRAGLRIRSRNITSTARGLLWQVRLLQGRMAELLPRLEAATARSGAHVPKVREALVVLARLEAGRGEDAQVALARLTEPDSATGAAGHTEPTCLALLAEISRRLGDPEAAERLLEQLRPYLPQHLVNQGGNYSGSSCHWAGVLSSLCGRHDEALALFDQALDGYRSLEARPWIAWTEEARARSLRIRDRPGDRAEAAVLLDQARTTASELGLGGLEARIQEQSQRAGA